MRREGVAGATQASFPSSITHRGDDTCSLQGWPLPGALRTSMLPAPPAKFICPNFCPTDAGAVKRATATQLAVHGPPALDE